MKNIRFYPTIWRTISYSFESIERWDTEVKTIKDLVLKNRFVLEKGVSEMTLNITQISAFDKNGKEHFIKDFTQQHLLKIKGMHSGLFLRSKSILNLSTGEYTALRFYLNSMGNRFGYSDRRTEPVYGLEYFDFEIDNGLKINGDEACQIILRFDFKPYTFSSYFKSVGQIFKRSKSFSSRLINSYGN